MTAWCSNAMGCAVLLALPLVLVALVFAVKAASSLFERDSRADQKQRLARSDAFDARRHAAEDFETVHRWVAQAQFVRLEEKRAILTALETELAAARKSFAPVPPPPPPTSIHYHDGMSYGSSTSGAVTTPYLPSRSRWPVIDITEADL